MADLSKLRDHLRDLAARAQPGDRLPPVRTLMRDFTLSQPSVQQVLADLKREGLIAAHIGRGTFFTRGVARGEDQAERSSSRKRARTVLILRRSSSTTRARVVIDDLQHRIMDGGDLALEVAYSDADHAKQVLQGMPRFDACVVQNSFEEMPIEMLAAIRRLTDTIVIDGTWLVGSDIDAVGFEWGEPVERAVTLLARHGHRRIGFVTSGSPFLANELGKQRYMHLRERPELRVTLHPALLLPQLPLHAYEPAVAAALRDESEKAGRLPFTGVIVWGIESGAAFRSALKDAGIAISENLSVVLLGRTDIEAERAGFFSMIGYSAAEQAEALYAKILARWSDPAASHAPVFIQVREREGASVRKLDAHAGGQAGLAPAS